MFGADEAGKGPVLGSMFAAAVVAESDALPDGVDDSKKLTPERREEIAAVLRADERVRIGVAEVPPARIDAPETDMNTLSVLAQANAIEQVVTDGMEGVVDAADTDAMRFGRRLTEELPVEAHVEAEHGADEVHAIVAAASVVAKVERDAHVARLADTYGTVGSGYPSDSTTREFLRTYVEERGELPDCARASWQTCDDVLAAAEQSALGEF